MAITTQEGTSTIGTAEFSLPAGSTTLTPQTTAGVYQLFLDLSNMTATEAYQITIYEKVKSAGTQRVAYQTTVYGVKTNTAWASPALALINGWDMTVKKLQGTDRSFDYSIRKAA